MTIHAFAGMACGEKEEAGCAPENNKTVKII
jgi:hypothetical protein